MDLQPGQDLLHYRIVEKIGEGGMGEVWKARDTTLEREVAIKFIPRQFAGDPERLARFTREAKMLATLNHPGIAGVYGLHEAGEGAHFIAMELVPGEDLAERLARGPLSVEDALDVARQVADALEAAHEQGVIHRDLKPANIRLTPEGKVKVLDLGLAKALIPESSDDSPSVSLSPTVTSAGTVAGTLLGTAGYMSPEQAKGRAADRRADIWAFGVVLYEMLTGRNLFQAETVSETLAAVLRDEVVLEGLPAGTPPAVRRLLGRCLDREPLTRLRDIGEARIALTPEALAAEPFSAVGSGMPDVAASQGSKVLPWALSGLFAIVAVVLLLRGTGGPATTVDNLALVAPIPDTLRIPVDQRGVLALSPDGKTIALALGSGDTEKLLYVRRLDSTELVPMPGTENASSPFFSPDGEWIGFIADDKLKKVPASGGTPVTLCDSDGNDRGATWGTDGTIVFAPHWAQPLMRVSEAGGEATPLTEIDGAAGERTHRWPQAVPDEDVVLFTVGTTNSPENYDGARIDAIRPSTGERKTVLERASMARYVASGHLVFGREGFLFAVPFDVKSLEVKGNPVPVLEGVMGMSASGVVHAEVAENGLLAYIAGAPQERKSRLVLRSRDGIEEPLAAPVAGYLQPRVSPDGKQIAVQYVDGANFDIWTYHIERNTMTRLTFEGTNSDPAWSPDGQRIAFASVRNNALGSSWVKAADGSGDAEMICSPEQFGDSSGQTTPRDWTKDGSSLVVSFTNQNAANLALCATKDRETEVLLETPAIEQSPLLSPNGRWLAYHAEEAGTFHVFVRAFPGSGGKWQVSTDGGSLPRWSHDGTELFYRYQNSLYSVAVDDSGESFESGRPELLFDDLRGATGVSYYDVFDAERFVLVENVGNDSPPPGVTVMLNWLDEVERRVPD